MARTLAPALRLKAERLLARGWIRRGYLLYELADWLEGR